MRTLMFGPSRQQLARMLERERERNRARETELLDRIMALAGQPWNLPVSESSVVEEPEVYVGAQDVLPEEWN